MNRIIFGLGSNLGDREFFLNQAMEMLLDELDLKSTKVSEILVNKALLPGNAPESWDIDFLNIAFSAGINIEKYDPLKILEIVKNIEVKIGRIDRGKWSPREIDIDILAIDDSFFDFGKKLQIPHTELMNRDFFKDKFFEIEPEIFIKIKDKIENVRKLQS